MTIQLITYRKNLKRVRDYIYGTIPFYFPDEFKRLFRMTSERAVIIIIIIIKVFIKNSLRKQTCDNLQGNKKNKGKSILITIKKTSINKN